MPSAPQCLAEARALPAARPLPAARGLSPAALRAIGVVGFPLLTALTSNAPWLAVPMPPFGVPQTLQTLWVVLAALCIGPRYGTLAYLGYLAVGVLGVPVFADGSAGVATLLGQTGGYLVGFVACQPVVAGILRRRDGSLRGWLALIAAVVSAHGVIFALGVPWLWTVRAMDGQAISWADAWFGGMVVFLPGMVLKSAAAVLIGRAVAPGAVRRVW